MNLNRLSQAAMFVLVSAVLTISAQASAFENLQSFLKAFHDNPYEMMQRRSDFVDASGKTQGRGFLHWESPEFQKKFAENRLLLEDVRRHSKFEYLYVDTDRPEIIVDNADSMIRNISAMQTQNFVKGEMTPVPYADSYWPIYLGLAAYRYADPGASRSKVFMQNYDYFQSHPTSSIVESGNPSAIDVLSPAEKYDLLIGDPNYSMTQYSWGKGLESVQRDHGVATWMGICHGWAAAASMNVPIPVTPIQTQTPSGRPVTFYPEDVKALQSMLWANSPPATRFAGDRCSIANPPRDSVGRIIDKACRGISPSTWHLSVVNQIGANKRSFILNDGHHAEIWNFPISAFKYHYFNPQTWEEGATLASTMIPLKDYKLDKFKQYRAPDAVYVVGIVLDLTYVIETAPSRAVGGENPVKTVRLIYDLELDADRNVVGEGEWYSNDHPDFIWTFARDAQAVAAQDSSLTESWDPSTPIPQSWSLPAQAAARRGVPLFSILKKFMPASPQ